MVAGYEETTCRISRFHHSGVKTPCISGNITYKQYSTFRHGACPIIPASHPIFYSSGSGPAEHEPGIRQLLVEANERLDALAADASPRTYSNTMLALEHVTENLDYALSVVRHLEAVATSPELRAAWNAVEPETSAFYSRIPLNEGLWKQLQGYAATDGAKSLSGAKLRFLTKTLDSFRRCGAELDAAGKNRLAEIDVELSKWTTKFSENVLDSTNAWE